MRISFKNGKLIIFVLFFQFLFMSCIFFQVRRVEAMTQLEDELYYAVAFNHEFIHDDPFELRIVEQVTWLGNITTYAGCMLTCTITSIDSSLITGKWNYSEAYSSYHDIRNFLDNQSFFYTPIIQDITNFIVWSITPETMDWNKLATTRSETISTEDIANGYIISAQYDPYANRYYENRSLYQDPYNTYLETQWRFSVDTTTGILDTLTARSIRRGRLGVNNDDLYGIRIDLYYPFKDRFYYYSSIEATLYGDYAITGLIVGVIIVLPYLQKLLTKTKLFNK